MAQGRKVTSKVTSKKVSCSCERARGELLHGVFNVVWLPGVARLHGGGARGAGTLTVDSATAGRQSTIGDACAQYLSADHIRRPMSKKEVFD